MKDKVCPQCHVMKPEDEFYLLRNGSRDSWCKECRKIHRRKYITPRSRIGK